MIRNWKFLAKMNTYIWEITKWFHGYAKGNLTVFYHLRGGGNTLGCCSHQSFIRVEKSVVNHGVITNCGRLLLIGVHLLRLLPRGGDLTWIKWLLLSIWLHLLGWLLEPLVLYWLLNRCLVWKLQDKKKRTCQTKLIHIFTYRWCLSWCLSLLSPSKWIWVSLFGSTEWVLHTLSSILLILSIILLSIIIGLNILDLGIVVFMHFVGLEIL